METIAIYFGIGFISIIIFCILIEIYKIIKES